MECTVQKGLVNVCAHVWATVTATFAINVASSDRTLLFQSVAPTVASHICFHRAWPSGGPLADKYLGLHADDDVLRCPPPTRCMSFTVGWSRVRFSSTLHLHADPLHLSGIGDPVLCSLSLLHLSRLCPQCSSTTKERLFTASCARAGHAVGIQENGTAVCAVRRQTTPRQKRRRRGSDKSGARN